MSKEKLPDNKIARTSSTFSAFKMIHEKIKTINERTCYVVDLSNTVYVKELERNYKSFVLVSPFKIDLDVMFKESASVTFRINLPVMEKIDNAILIIDVDYQDAFRYKKEED